MRKLVIVALAAGAVLGPGVFIGSATGSSPHGSCMGMTATIVGTQHADVINGTTGADVIVACGGND